MLVVTLYGALAVEEYNLFLDNYGGGNDYLPEPNGMRISVETPVKLQNVTVANHSSVLGSNLYIYNGGGSPIAYNRVIGQLTGDGSTTRVYDLSSQNIYLFPNIDYYVVLEPTASSLHQFINPLQGTFPYNSGYVNWVSGIQWNATSNSWEIPYSNSQISVNIISVGVEPTDVIFYENFNNLPVDPVYSPAFSGYDWNGSQLVINSYGAYLPHIMDNFVNPNDGTPAFVHYIIDGEDPIQATWFMVKPLEFPQTTLTADTTFELECGHSYDIGNDVVYFELHTTNSTGGDYRESLVPITQTLGCLDTIYCPFSNDLSLSTISFTVQDLVNDQPDCYLMSDMIGRELVEIEIQMSGRFNGTQTNNSFRMDNIYISQTESPPPLTCVIPTTGLTLPENDPVTFCSGTYYADGITVGNNVQLNMVGTTLYPDVTSNNTAILTMGTGSGLICDIDSQFINTVDALTKDAVVFNDWAYMYGCYFENFDSPDVALKVYADNFAQFYYNNFQNSNVYPFTGDTYWFHNIFTKPVNFNTPLNEFHTLIGNQILAGFQIEGYGGFNITENHFAGNDFNIITGVNMGVAGAYFYNNTIDGVNLYETNAYYDDVVYCVDGIGNNFINGGAYTGLQTSGGTCSDIIPFYLTYHDTNWNILEPIIRVAGQDILWQMDVEGSPIDYYNMTMTNLNTSTVEYFSEDFTVGHFYEHSISMGGLPLGDYRILTIIDGEFDHFESYLDFTLIGDVCVENWVVDVEQCTISDLLYREYVDTNDCGTTDDRPADHMNPTDPCNYCTVEYSYEETECIDNQKDIIYNLENGAVCCDLTLIPEDCEIPDDMIGVECGFIPQHDTNQITGLVIDTSVEMGKVYIGFAGLIALLGLAGWVMFLL